MHQYTKTCIRYNIPNTINNTTSNIIDKIYTHSIQGFSGYIKQCLLQSYNDFVQLLTAVYVLYLKVKTILICWQILLTLNFQLQSRVSVSLQNQYRMLTVTMCIQNKSKLGLGLHFAYNISVDFVYNTTKSAIIYNITISAMWLTK